MRAATMSSYADVAYPDRDRSRGALPTDPTRPIRAQPHESARHRRAGMELSANQGASTEGMLRLPFQRDEMALVHERRPRLMALTTRRRRRPLVAQLLGVEQAPRRQRGRHHRCSERRRDATMVLRAPPPQRGPLKDREGTARHRPRRDLHQVAAERRRRRIATAGPWQAHPRAPVRGVGVGAAATRTAQAHLSLARACAMQSRLPPPRRADAHPRGTAARVGASLRGA